jgi:hypothetical protein
MKWALLILFFGTEPSNALTLFDTQLRFHSWDQCVKEAEDQLGDVRDNITAFQRQRGGFYRNYRQSNWSCVPSKS